MALDDALKQLTVDLHREFKRLKETKRMRRSSIFSVQPKSSTIWPSNALFLLLTMTIAEISVVNLEDFAKNLEIAAQTPINDSPIHEDAQDSEVIINDDAHERDSEDELKSDFGSDHRLRSIILQEAGRQENNEEDVSQNTATSLGKSVLLSQLRELAEVPSDMNESEMH